MTISIDRSRLPSTAALTAFDAAAKLKSFTEAARHLNLTQGAISRQIKILEEQLGVSLFERTGHRVTLTPAGRAMAIQIRSILDQLALTLDRADQKYETTLEIGVLPTFATRWLIPRLPEFLETYPSISLRLLTFRREFNPETTLFDAVVTLGTDVSPDIISHRIADEEFIVVATPAWFEKHGVQTPVELVGKTYLSETTRPTLWAKWFTANEIFSPTDGRPVEFNHFDMVIAGALSGLGAALVPRVLVAEELAAGRLSVLNGKPLTVGTSYFLNHQAHKANYLPLLLFKNWLLSKINAH